jgi:hypothetical protein
VFFSPASTLTVCSGDNTTITASGGISYGWSNGATVASITVSPASTTSYDVTVTDGNGCSSTGAASVIVNQSSHVTDTATICSGGSYSFGGHSLTTAGTYSDTLSTVHGCDSIITLRLFVTPYLTNAYGVTVCGGSSFPFNGQNLTQAGVYRDTLTSSQGCDSIIILTLAFDNSISTTINSTTCANTGYLFGGRLITATGTYYDTLTASGGCDSIVTLNLVVKEISSINFSDSICPGSSYNFNGRLISGAGVYRDTLTNIVGCDSIDTICTYGGTIGLIPAATPLGGTYTGTGVEGGDSLNTSTAGTPPYNITYAVTASNGCVSTDTRAFVASNCIIGINEVNIEKEVKLYPNPTNGIITVECAWFSNSTPAPVIYSLTGEAIETGYERDGGKFILFTGKLAAGVYFVHFNVEGVNVNMKFVKLD